MTNRNLTDDDVDAIVQQLKSELITDFYGEVGRGVWAWFRKVFWATLLIVAVYGMSNHKALVDTVQVARP
ncbi:MAG: hypothetical protein KKA12_08570 [Alphaproteobacteria bacterium]|nr:hypothetical protein [Alphaproteobacteria bacterium]